MSDFRDRLKFAAARAAGASRTSAELRELAEPRKDATARPGTRGVVELPADLGADATVTLAMVRSTAEAAADD